MVYRYTNTNHDLPPMRGIATFVGLVAATFATLLVGNGLAAFAFGVGSAAAVTISRYSNAPH